MLKLLKYAKNKRRHKEKALKPKEKKRNSSKCAKTPARATNRSGHATYREGKPYRKLNLSMFFYFSLQLSLSEKFFVEKNKKQHRRKRDFRHAEGLIPLQTYHIVSMGI